MATTTRTPATTNVLDAPVLDTAGGATTLRAWLGPGATVFVFLRHFG
jgi:hypothetical protein